VNFCLFPTPAHRKASPRLAGLISLVSALLLTVSFGSVGPYLDGAFPAADPGESNFGLPLLLSETGAFSDLATLEPVAGLTPYDVNAPLWSDGAKKLRWIAVPSDGVRDSAEEKIVFRADAPWTFPVGTVLVKHFELATDEIDPSVRRRLETRFLIILPGGSFYGVTYRWRADGSEADLLGDGASTTVTIQKADGSTRDQTWDFPARLDCTACHNLGAGAVLGVETHQLNGDYSYPTGTRHQLREWSDQGLFDVPVEEADLPSLLRSVHVNDSSESLERRVRSYLDANCSHCHYPGNLSTGFDLRYTTPLNGQHIVNGEPLYPLGIPDAKVVAPGDPSASVMHYRMQTTGVHRMPALGSVEVDAVALETLEAWITSLPSSGNAAPVAVDDVGRTFESTSVELVILGNDSDADGDLFSVDLQGSASNGSLVWNGSGTVSYTPNGGFVGSDAFTYALTDSEGNLSNTATVMLTVSPSISSNDLGFADRSDLLPSQTMRSGAAMGVMDMNQDGLDDVVHLNNRRYLYIGYQGASETDFSQLSLGRVSASNQWGMAIGDTNQDGFPDIATGGAYDGVHYYRAQESGSSYYAKAYTSPVIFTQAINFADIDQDGWLDLFVCHDVGRNSVFRNQQDGNLVFDNSLINTGEIEGNYGSVWTDYDNDGDLDLYVSKCRSSASSPTDPRRINQLFRNDNGTYVEVAAAAGLAFGEQSWTADFGDIDNDGDLDCFVGNHMADSYLCENNGDGTFTNITATSGITTDWNVIQSVFRDFNNDGWVDLLLTGQDHEIWLNDRDGTFSRRDPFSGGVMHSCAVGDLNHDGFTDIFAGYGTGYNTASGYDRMWHATPNANGFLSVTLDGVQSNRQGSGARLELHGPWGTQVREVRNGESYGVTHSVTQIFGLGNQAVADKLVVRWPSGVVDEVFNVAANQFLNLREGSTQAPLLTYPGNQVSSPGEVVSLSVMASDPTGDELSFAAVNLPSGLEIDSISGEISGIVALDAVSTTVLVSVSDGWQTVAVSLQWLVNAPGDVTRPTVALAGPAGVINGPTTLRIETSEAVTGFTVNDIYLFNAVASDFLGSGSSYRVTLTPTGDGPTTAIIPDNFMFDAAGNGNVVSNQVVFESNISVPEPALLATVSSASENFAVGVTFSEEIVGLDFLDFRVTNGFATSLSGSGSGYALFVTPLAGGDVEIYLPANRAADLYGNGNSLSNVVVVPNDLAALEEKVGEVASGSDADGDSGSELDGPPQLVTQSVSSDSMIVAWSSVIDVAYAVDYSTDLEGWIEHSIHLGDGEMQEVQLDLAALGHPKRLFVRLRAPIAE